MDIESYTTLIAESVAESGYDRFLPSLCISSDGGDDLNVLDTVLRDEGEKELSLNWAAQSIAENQKAYCAYRIGNRIIEIVEIIGRDVTAKNHLDVRPNRS